MLVGILVSMGNKLSEAECFLYNYSGEQVRHYYANKRIGESELFLYDNNYDQIRQYYKNKNLNQH